MSQTTLQDKSLTLMCPVCHEVFRAVADDGQVEAPYCGESVKLRNCYRIIKVNGLSEKGPLLGDEDGWRTDDPQWWAQAKQEEGSVETVPPLDPSGDAGFRQMQADWQKEDTVQPTPHEQQLNAALLNLAQLAVTRSEVQERLGKIDANISLLRDSVGELQAVIAQQQPKEE